jgi:enterochelin esterase-like enzyme
VFYDRMKQGKMPKMIWVLLDESSPTGTHEFADSVNNGPWGEALTTELIPELERTYRMDAVTSGRFLQ